MITVLLVLILCVATAVLVLGFMQMQIARSAKRPDDSLKQDLITALGELEHRLKGDMSISRREQADSLKAVGDSLDRRLAGQAKISETKLERVRAVVENRLQLMQKDNNEKLEVMRATVDEKLQSTLERRLGESFKHVSERLEQVHKGLGEMQNLASGVGDLKKVLTNIKTRGTWGEVQLGNLLEQVMSVGQYERNVAVRRRSSERVEFAIKIPVRNDDDRFVWLPIDAKFPVEDYQRLIAAREAGDAEASEKMSKELEARIKSEAKTISDKYIAPPETTDYALLYLPTEGLYAEVTQRPGLQESLQRQYRVVVAGPSTVAALLNTLQMGFRTLAIEKRSSEVWQTLAVVKNEFGKFGDLLEKTQKKLQEAGDNIELAASKSRNISRKLEKVQGLPDANAQVPEGVAEQLVLARSSSRTES
jgi:DNA recombination protein RmuC